MTHLDKYSQLHCIVSNFTSNTCAGAKGGLSGLDLSRIAWQKISRKGDFPSTRCGTALAMYKSKALLFGGVFDEEGEIYSTQCTQCCLHCCSDKSASLVNTFFHLLMG